MATTPDNLSNEDIERIKKYTDYVSSWDSASYKFLKNLKEANIAQDEMTKSTKSYIDRLKEYTKLNEQIKKHKQGQAKFDADALKKADELELKGKEKLDFIEKVNKGYKDELDLLEKQTEEIERQVKQSSFLKVAAKDLGKAMVKTIGNLPNIIQRGYGQLKNTGLFDMDKAIRTSSLSMGLLGKQSESFKTSVLTSAQGVGKLDGLTAQLGISVEDIAQYQSDYSDELGRTVMLGQDGSKAIAELAKGTILGSEGAAKMAAELDNFAMSADKVRDFMSQALNDASHLGLNAGKVTKNIQHNIGMLNKYDFKDGVNGLAMMAKTVAKLGIDMATIAPMADKLWDIEGAVEMSAQLQVLGGAFSSLADPFKLMYMARNDVDGLTKSLAEAASESMTFAKDGSIELSTMEMSRLKKVAEETGVSYDAIVKAGKNIKKFQKISPQISFDADDKEKEFLENVAQLDEHGRAFIQIGLGPDGKVMKQYIDQLGSTGRSVIQAQIKENANLADRAKAAMTFDDKLMAVINGLKVDLYPIVDVMDKKLVPALGDFVGRFIKDGWADKLVTFAQGFGEIISTVGKLILEWPKTFLALMVGGKVFGFLFDNAKWFLNGMALSNGFNAAMLGEGGLSTWVKTIGAGLGPILAGAIGGVLGLGAGKGITNLAGHKDTTEGDMWGIAGGLAGGLAGGAVTGGEVGMFAGPVGAAIGVAIGAAVGAMLGKAGGDWANTPQGYSPQNSIDTHKFNDAVVKFNPNDKFTKVNDGTMIAGTNVNGNKDLAKALNGNPITSPNQSSSVSNNLNVNLSELKISGMIELKLGNNVSRELGDSLLQDPSFIRNISKMINVEMGRVKNIKPA